MTAVTLQPADAGPAPAPIAPTPIDAAPAIRDAMASPNASRVPSLRRNFSMTFAGNVFYAGCQWGTLVVLAKLGSPEGVGQYALGLALTAPIILLFNLQLRDVQATDARREHPFGDYLALRLLCTVLALLVIAGMVLVLRPPTITVLVIAGVALAKAADSVADILFGLLQQRERMAPVAASLAVNGAATLAATFVAMYLTRSIAWAAAASAFGSAVAAVLAWVTTARVVGVADVRPRWDNAAVKTLAAGTIPLGVIALLVSLNTNMPRYFVEHHIGERALGVFAAMAYIQTAGASVAAALAQSGGARLSQRYAASDLPGFWRILCKMMGVGAALGLGGLAVAAVGGRFVLTLLYRPEYAAAAPAFVWLMAAATVAYMGMFLNTAMLIVKARRAQTILFVVVLAVGTASCAVLVPRHGLVGAAWAVGVSYTVQMAGALYIVSRSLRVRPFITTPAAQPLPIQTTVS